MPTHKSRSAIKEVRTQGGGAESSIKESLGSGLGTRGWVSGTHGLAEAVEIHPQHRRSLQASGTRRTSRTIRSWRARRTYYSFSPRNPTLL